MERQILTLCSKEVKLHPARFKHTLNSSSCPGVLVTYMEIEVEEGTEIRNQ